MNPGFGPLEGNHQLDAVFRHHYNSHSLPIAQASVLTFLGVIKVRNCGFPFYLPGGDFGNGKILGPLLGYFPSHIDETELSTVNIKVVLARKEELKEKMLCHDPFFDFRVVGLRVCGFYGPALGLA